MSSPAPSAPGFAAPCLVADIGGTNARFALAWQGPGGRRADIGEAQVRRVDDFASIADAANDYLASFASTHRPRRAVFAVAGPVQGDEVAFSNSRWSFSTAQLRRALEMDSLHVINDFAAVAWAVPALAPEELDPIGELRDPGIAWRGTRVVVGPGTGLGVAAIHPQADAFDVRASEGGHASFAPRDEDEIYLMRFLKARHGRVSSERLLCGDGLLALYQATCARDAEAPRWHRAEDVTRAAREGDVLARTATRMFCGILGSFAGDVALMFCAWDGVYLAGGMLGHVLDAGHARLFRQRFEEKGRFAPILRTVPTWRIVREDVGKLGAAMYDARQRGRERSAADEPG
jgi:glucokinase